MIPFSILSANRIVPDLKHFTLDSSLFADLHQIQLFGITILEPSTVLSSLMMTVVCMIALVKAYPHRHLPVAFWTIGFLIFMGLATAIGGILGHGFLYTTGKMGKLPGWVCGIIALALYERGVMYRLKNILNETQFRRLLLINVVGLLIFIVLTLYYVHFQIPQYHAFYSLLLLVGSIELYLYRRFRNPGSLYILSAIGCAAMAGLAHISGINFGVWFQENDLSHIPMAGSIWLLYAGMAKSEFQAV